MQIYIKIIKIIDEYIRASCFSLTSTTFANAVKKGDFMGWPGLDPNTILQHISGSH